MIDDAELQAESRQIENLLSELRELVPWPAWQRIEAVLRGLVRLYGTGLARALEHARAAGAVGSSFDELLCNDELLASLLVLHSLHPLTTEQRVERALERLRRELGGNDDTLVLAKLDEDGVVHLVAGDRLAGGSVSTGLAESMIRRVIESAAPEVASIQITGLPRPPDPSLVQLGRSRPAS